MKGFSIKFGGVASNGGTSEQSAKVSPSKLFHYIRRDGRKGERKKKKKRWRGVGKGRRRARLTE